MNLQRLAPNQISTPLSLEAARESVWRGFAQSGLLNVLIDREKNLVAGSTNAGWKTNGETITAYFTEDAGSTVIEVKAKSHFGAKLDFGRLKRLAKKITDAVEAALSVAPGPLAPTMPTAFVAVAPIAAPTGESSYIMGAPVYGTVMPAKRGQFIMIYAVLGLLLIHILSPVSWIFANKALKEYGDTDPGDKKLVKTARVVGIVGTVILIGIWGLQLSALGS